MHHHALLSRTPKLAEAFAREWYGADYEAKLALLHEIGCPDLDEVYMQWKDWEPRS